MTTTDELHTHEIDFRPRADTFKASGEHHKSLRRILVAGDAVAALLAWALPSLTDGARLRSVVQHPTALSVIASVLILSGCVLFTLGLIASERLYLSRICTMRSLEISKLTRVAFVVGIVALIKSKFVGEIHLVRVPILIAASMFVFLNIWRSIYTTWLKDARRHDRFTRSVILLGSNDEAYNLYRHIKRHPELGYRVRGVVGWPNEMAQHPFESPWMGEVFNLPSILQRTGVKGALVAGGALGRPRLNLAVRQLLDHQVHVHMSTGINGIDHRRLQSHSLAFEPMVYVERVTLEAWQEWIKRAIDLALTSMVLILSSPVLLASAVAIKLHDRGPIFFRQERVGRNGELFTILKFRSMVSGAEAQQVDLREQNIREGPLFKLAFDPRVTGIGRILRATSIDELPQLLNVIKGDMSLVGPRPALPSEVESFGDKHLTRQNVMPGITGLWQVEGRDNPDFSLYERLDVFYTENWSVALDISILLGTAKVVIIRAWQSLVRLRAKEAARAGVVLD